MVRQMIRLIVTDIDGVLTNGRCIVDEKMRIYKELSFKDIDAIVSMRQEGYKFGIITGEADCFTEYLYNKVRPDYYETGRKDKKNALLDISNREGCSLDEICYIGDGKYDVEAIRMAGLGICPKDAIDEALEAADVILKSSGGEGCLAELLTLLRSKKADSKEPEWKEAIDKTMQQHVLLAKEVWHNEAIRRAIENAIQMMVTVFRKKGQVLLCGNGGSAADAQHLSTELVSRFYMERSALNAEALTVNTSALTGIGNDYSFEKVFSRQVEAKGNAGDILVGITTSGTSENVLEALETAKQKGMRTIVFTGLNTDAVTEWADVIISIPSEVTPRIQEAHIMIGHVICEQVESLLFHV